MSQTFITLCPHCNTRFRVSDEQLFAASGAVRCGACMQVFNARLHLEQDETCANPAPLPDAADFELHARPQIAASLDSLKIHDDLEIDLDSPDFEEELARLARQEAEQARIPQPEPLYTYEEDDSRLLPVVVSEDEIRSDPPADETAEDLHVYADDPEDWPSETGADEDAITAMQEEPDEPHAAPGPADRRLEPSVLHDEVEAIGNEPLYLEWQPRQKNSESWLWVLGCLLAVIGLAVQYCYFNFDQLARQQATRPWLEAVCKIAGCQLPERVDVSLITSSNLVVRPHAEFRNALSVDAIIYNRAGFAQPFPLLQLNFMDDKEQLLASRSFSPQEYLGGELAGRTSMPAQTPIRIALDVLVPDARASGYSIRFLSPD